MSITGFSNTRSSEYMILNDLYSNVKSKYKIFYPLFFQKRRDNTNLSLLNNVPNLQVIACFARRPKTDSVLSNKTIITFRRSIFEHADFLNKLDIPVLAASPIGTTVDSIGFGSKCKWFRIDAGIDSEYEEYRFYDGEILHDCHTNGINLIQYDQLDKILLSAPEQNWIEIIRKIEGWDREYSNYYFLNHGRSIFNYVSGLKPVFIVYQILKR